MRQNITQNESRFLALLQNTLFQKPLHMELFLDMDYEDWKYLFAESYAQQMEECIWEAIHNLAAIETIPGDIYESWEVLVYSSLYRKEVYWYCLQDLCEVLAKENIRFQIIKGITIGCFYPKMEYRKHGDIDILVSREDYKNIGQILEKYGYEILIGRNSKHMSLNKKGIEIEVHQTVFFYDDKETGKRFQEIMEELPEESYEIEINGERYPVLSEKKQCILMLAHMAGHMQKKGCGITYLCDWAMFLVHNHNNPNLEKWIQQELKEIGMRRYALLLTECCVKYLGIPAPSFSVPCKEGMSYELFRELYDAGNSGRKRMKATSPVNFSKGKSGRWVVFEKWKYIHVSRVWTYFKEIINGTDYYKGFKQWFAFIRHNKVLYDEVRLFFLEED